MFGYDEFTNRRLLLKSPPMPDELAPAIPGPYPREMDEADIALVQAALQRRWMARLSADASTGAVVTTASLHRFHPVRDWLATLQWDGCPRLDRWLIDTFGATDTDYARAVGSKFLIAAVRRVRQPGCKFDHMLLLQGPQAIGKSTALRVLFSDRWFSDAMYSKLESKDAPISLRGVWCLEFAEIDLLLRTEVETVKAFITRQSDRYREPYGRGTIDVARQGVLAGTTNSDDPLRDATGNRRFWPLSCRFARPDLVAEQREQIWAEAAAREAAGESHWLDDPEIQAAAAIEQNDRQEEDIWTDRIRVFLFERDVVTVAQVLDALSVPVERHDKRQQMRVGRVLRLLSWTRLVIRVETQHAANGTEIAFLRHCDHPLPLRQHAM